MSESDIAARVAQLEKQLADLQARLPAHSTPPSMIAELDELEEALAQAQRERQEFEARRRQGSTFAYEDKRQIVKLVSLLYEPWRL